MAYFRNNEQERTGYYPTEDDTEEEYDDGFDELTDTDNDAPEMTAEKRRMSRLNRFRIAVGAGNLLGVILGTVLILIMLTLIFSMIHFVISDMGRSFSLFQTNF